MPSVDTRTHCPYCSLQCGITLDRRRGRPATVAAAAGVPDQPGRAVPEGLDRRPSCSTIPQRLPPTGPDRARRPRQPARTGHLGRGARPDRRTASAGSRRAHGRDAVGVLRRRRADQREGVRARQVRPGRPAHRRRSTTTAASACPRRRRRPTGRSASTAGCRSRWPTSPSADAILPRRRQPGRDHAAGHAVLRRSSARGGTLIVVDPRRTADRRRADAAPAAAARHRPRAGQRPAARRDHATGWSTRTTSRDRTTGFDGGAAGVARLLAGAGRADHRRAGRRRCGDRARCWPTRRAGDGPDRARRRAAHARAPTRLGLHQPRAGARPARASRAPATACLTGQGNGQGGREHGQKADQLPGYRRLDDPAARAHVAGGLGRRSRRRCPAPGCRRTRLLDRAGHRRRRRGRCCVMASNVVVSAPDANRVARPAAPPSTCSSSPTSSCPRPPSSPTSSCPTAQWAEEEGTMTNLEGRVIRRRRAPAAARRRPHDLAGARRRWPTGSGRGTYFARRPASRCSTSCGRASAGGIADYAGITYERIDAERRRVLAVPDRGPPGHAAAVRRPLPDAGRPGPLPPGRAPPTRPRRPTPTTRTC